MSLPRLLVGPLVAAALAACTNEPEVELVLTIRMGDGISASFEGVDVQPWSMVTRTLPDFGSLLEAVLEFTMHRGAESGTASAQSFCTSDVFPNHMAKGGVLVRENLQVYLSWPAEAAAPTAREEQGSCEFDNGQHILWIP